MRIQLTLTALSAIGLLPAFAQTKPAPVLEIFRESVKEGRSAAHEKIETDYAAAFRKANHPAHYIAFTAMSGPGEAWFVQPMPSFAAAEEYDAASQKEPLKSALALLESRDGEVRTSSRNVWAVYRPDMSYKPEKFDGAKTRFVAVGTMRVKLGMEADFLAAAKMYLGGLEKGDVDQCTLAYQVVAGAPSGTYFFFTVMDSMSALDGTPARNRALQQAMGPENLARFMKSTGDLFVSVEDTLLQVNPGMSYPPQEYVNADAFWKPKLASAAAAPADKKAGQ